MKYSVQVTRTTIEETEVIVEADDEDEAETNAKEVAQKSPSSVDWELIDEDFETQNGAEELAEEE